MESCLDCRDPSGIRSTGKLVVTGAGSITLLGFFSSLWQLVLKELPWLILVYYSVHQALKGHLFLASFSWASLVAQLVKNLPAMQETCV